MTHDSTALDDQIATTAGYSRPTSDATGLSGQLHVVLTAPDGEVKLDETVPNTITQVGEQMYAERGAGVGSLAAPTGMALGTGSTAAAKTGAGAALVTGVAASAVALSGAATSALSGSGNNPRRITYAATWGAGTATANGIAEVVLQNGTATTVPANGTATNVVARSVLGTTVNKGASDSLTITWTQDIGVA